MGLSFSTDHPEFLNRVANTEAKTGVKEIIPKMVRFEKHMMNALSIFLTELPTLKQQWMTRRSKEFEVVDEGFDNGTLVKRYLNETSFIYPAMGEKKKIRSESVRLIWQANEAQKNKPGLQLQSANIYFREYLTHMSQGPNGPITEGFLQSLKNQRISTRPLKGIRFDKELRFKINAPPRKTRNIATDFSLHANRADNGSESQSVMAPLPGDEESDGRP